MLVVTDQHTVWAWGANTAGQLGTGCTSRGRTSGLEAAVPAPEAAADSAPGWVAAPLEVVDSAAAAAMGLPVSASCGEEHSALLCRSGQVWGAGSNAAGACGLPIVQLAAAVWSEVPLPASAGPAAAVSCGGRNTAVVTRAGRLLVCGSNECGQAAMGRQGGCCYLLAEVGPSAAWHGMQRTNQLAGGGGGDAANRAVGVACGSGSLYALTSSGEVFSWGQGSQGAGWVAARCQSWCSWPVFLRETLSNAPLRLPPAPCHRRAGPGRQQQERVHPLTHALGARCGGCGGLQCRPLCSCGG